MAVTAQQVQQLYVGYLGRAADQAGLDYWLNELNAENASLTLENLRSNFVNEQPEYAATYQGLNRQQTVSKVYDNVFGRTPTDAEVAYWTFDSNVNTDQLITAFFNAASPTDRLIIESNVAAAQQVTNAYAGSSLTGTALTTQLATATDAYVITSTTTGTGSSAVTTYQVGGAGSFTTIQAAAQDASQKAQADFGTTFGSSVPANATLTPNFYGTSASITLNNLTDAATITLANQAGGNLHDLTINGSVGATSATSSTLTLTTAAGTTAAPADPTATTDVTSLKLGLTSNTQVVLATLTDLKTIDASTSTGNLTIDASAAGFTQLASVMGGSGNDTLTVGGVAQKGSLSVMGGAGNDNLTVVSGDGALTVDAGAGNDVVSLTANAATSTDAHSAAITLGAGNDRLNVATLANLTGDVGVTGTSTAAQVEAANTALTANMVTVTDFNTSQDVISLSGLDLASFNNIEAGSIGSAGSLAQALALVAGGLEGTENAATFNYGGNAYVFTSTDTTVGTGDGLIQLTGVTTALNEGGNLLVA